MMTKRISIISLCAITLLALHCKEGNFDNPLDPDGTNYRPPRVTFNVNGSGGTVVPEILVVNRTGNLPSLPTPARTGYTFVNWYTTSDATGGTLVTTSMEINANTTVYARWAVVTYSIAYNLNGGTNHASNPESYNIETPVTLNAPTLDGRTFGGWYDNSDFNGSAITSVTAGSTGDKALWAKWIPQYTISFDLNGGTGIVPASQTADSMATITLPDSGGLSRYGYAFAGWNTNSGGTGIDYGVGASYPVTGDATLYAKWKWIPQYTISFDLNGGTGTVPVSQTADSMATITLPDGDGLSRYGHTFLGWNTNSDGTGIDYSAGASYLITDDATLYAKWMPQYTITFDLNGGTGTVPASQTADSMATITLPDGSELSRYGHTFLGWNTDSDGTGIDYGAGASYLITDDATLYAKWNESCETFTEGTTRFHFGKTKSQFCDPRDGKRYVYVTIGTQVWMAENLNYAVSSSLCYNNSVDSCAKYGRLYTWNTAMNGASSSNTNPSGVRGVCPDGWHLPSIAEWNVLVDFAGDPHTAGSKLKSQTSWEPWAGISSTDEFGFSALPGGARWINWGDGMGVGNHGYWWSATEGDGDAAMNARLRTMSYNHGNVGDNWGNRADEPHAFSVRCIRDD